jgi:hypothetical protein
VPSKVYDHDLGEPDDLFADMHNFAVNAVIHLNLMILVMEERKITFMGLCH